MHAIVLMSELSELYIIVWLFQEVTAETARSPLQKATGFRTSESGLPHGNLQTARAGVCSGREEKETRVNRSASVPIVEGHDAETAL